MAQRQPQGLTEVHAACGEGGTHRQKTGSEQAKVGPVVPQPGCTQPGIGPDPGVKTQVWQLGFGWLEMQPVQPQQLPEKKEQTDTADYLFWTENVNKGPQFPLPVYCHRNKKHMKLISYLDFVP